MISHRMAHRQFDPFVRGELDPLMREQVERHLRVCAACRAEYDRLRQVTDFLRRATPPSQHRPEEYWNTFAERVENRIVEHEFLHPSWSEAVMESLGMIVRLRWRTALAIAGSFAALAIAVILLQTNHSEQPAQTATITQHASEAAFDQKVDRYFRRSQAVLVGLSNMTPRVGKDVGIDAERNVSRELAQEARLLKHQRLDPRSARLVGDLEKIFIVVANADQHDQVHDIELIRGGIQQQNLLFKVRMAQARYATGQNIRGNQ